MKLYFLKGACSFASRILINELGLKCKFESVDRTKKTASGEDYLSICSKGYTPALKLDSGTLLTEGSAILQYLAEVHESHDLLPQMSDIRRYDVLAWVNYIATELHKNCSPLFNPSIPDSIKDAIFRPNLKARLAFVEKELEGKEFIATDKFTIADCYLYTIITWFGRLNVDITPNIAAYKARLDERPSIKKSVEQEA